MIGLAPNAKVTLADWVATTVFVICWALGYLVRLAITAMHT